MRIIRSGKHNNNPEVKAKCTRCFCLVAFNLQEGEFTGDIDGDYYTIKCPECPGYITISAQRVWDEIHAPTP
jgi:hypothetical protein